jgi:hypothetical protein
VPPERVGIRLTWLSAKISPSATQPIAHDAPSPASISCEIRCGPLVEIALAGEERRDELAPLQHEVEVLRHAALVLPALVFLALDAQHRSVSPGSR